MAEPTPAIVLGLAVDDAERPAGEFFEAFAAGATDGDLTELPAGRALDLLFELDDDPTV